MITKTRNYIFETFKKESNKMQKELGIYIHIPFCKQKCYYCDFISYSNKCNKIEEYIRATNKEILAYDFETYNITTIYIGGGTPSYIDSKYIKGILELLKGKLKNNKTKFEDIEITIEVNPGTVTENKIKDYKDAGINRISIGLQSTKNVLLKQIGRIHTYEEFLDSYSIIKKVGIDNINVDLMIGLPNQTIEDIKESLEKIVQLQPNHISVYSLIVEDGTLISKLLYEEKIKLPDEEQERRMYWYVKNFLELNEYKHYEISNFAKKGKESKHNLNCWNQVEYIGIGIAAHSYLNRVRYSNTINLENYIKNIESGDIKGNITIEEKQTIEDQKKEFMMLGFRKIEGVDIAKFKEKFVENPIYLYRKELNKLVEENLIEIDLNNIKLTRKGLDLANQVFEEFI